MEQGHIAGISACIIKNGDISWIGNYGYANIELDIPVDTSTLFYMASISKTVTVTALLQLWEQGLFELDDDINDYLPFNVHNPNYSSMPVTFRMLCTHTSSIKDNDAVNPYYWGEDSPIPLGQFLYDYLDPEGANYFPTLNFYSQPPGTAYYYSNVGAALLGYLVEVMGDSTFSYQTKERIFEPLQMNETAWFMSELDTAHIAMPYYWNGNNYIPYGYYALSSYPAGALRTSINQLSNFLLAYMNEGSYLGEEILQSSTIEMTMTPQVPSIYANIGLMWDKIYLGGRCLWGHDGGNLGAMNTMRYCREENTGVIAFSNGVNVAVGNQIIDLLFDFAADSIPCSCLPEGITFTTQEEIDNFQINYPNCTEIEGDVTIGYNDGTVSDITNLNGLSVLTSAGGDFRIINNATLTSLIGLDNMTYIGGNISIGNNDALTSLTGLEGLTSIGGDLEVGFLYIMTCYGNSSLTSLEGLYNLTSIGGGLKVICNESLPNLTGLENIASIAGELHILYNDGLVNLTGLEGLTSIGGTLSIGGNDTLPNLMGLDNVTSIGGNLEIGFQFGSLNGNLSLVSLTGLEGLTSIGGNLEIGKNDALTSLSGLDNVTSIGGNLEIGIFTGNINFSGNLSLASLEGLHSVTSIGGWLLVKENDALSGLQGLDSIDAGSITNLYIWSNSSLSSCEAQSICDYLSAPNGEISIQDNSPGCNNVQEVADACDSITLINNEMVKPDLSILPNPVNRQAVLSLNIQSKISVEICICNTTGICLKKWYFQNQQTGQVEFNLDLKDLQAGIYFCSVQIGNEMVTKKIIKTK